MLRNRFGVKAVEMEAASVADAAWEPQVGYLVIRGVSDYCDPGKNDRWQHIHVHCLLALIVKNVERIFQCLLDYLICFIQ
jgi:nucleoside phosphorylase